MTPLLGRQDREQLHAHRHGQRVEHSRLTGARYHRAGYEDADHHESRGGHGRRQQPPSRDRLRRYLLARIRRRHAGCAGRDARLRLALHRLVGRRLLRHRRMSAHTRCRHHRHGDVCSEAQMQRAEGKGQGPGRGRAGDQAPQLLPRQDHARDVSDDQERPRDRSEAQARQPTEPRRESQSSRQQGNVEPPIRADQRGSARASTTP